MKANRTVVVNISVSYTSDETTTITSGGTSDSASITLSGFAIPVKYVDKSNKLTDLPTDDVVDSNGNYTINSSLFGVNSNDYTLYWKVGSNRYLPGDTLTGITSALTLTASVEKNCTVTYDPYYDGVHGVPYTKTAKSAGTLYTIPEDFRAPTLEGYTFLGWTVTSDNATLDADGNLTGITGDVTLTAQWAKNGATHTVSFLPGAADAYIPFLTPATVEEGQPYQIPDAVPTREGWEFKGWSCSNGTTYEANASIENVTTDLTLTAVWQKEQVTVTYPTTTELPAGVTYTGTAPTTGPVDKGSNISFRLTLTDGYDPATLVVTANGVALAPVKAEGGSYQYTFTADADTTISVKEPGKVAYTVMMPVGHFAAQITDVSGTAQPVGTTSASVEHGGSYTFTVTPDEGYTVKRVAVNGAAIDATNGSYTVSNVTTAQTVEVVVDELPVYIVIYNSNNSQYAFQRVTAGSKATLPAAPEVEGYTFGGWYTGQNGTGDEFTAETAITGDITVYAKLTANTYTITYDLNGADGTAPTAQNKTHGQAVQLDNAKPTREGYKFLGWGTTANATTPSYQPGDMYSVDANITLYAVWQPNTYTVTLPSGGTGFTVNSDQSRTVAYNGSFTFTVTVDRLYASDAPTVKANSAKLTDENPTLNPDGSKTYSYTISNIKEDQSVSVQAVKNLVYTVTFMTGTSVYQTQEVGYGEKATRPVDPTVEGYTFGGWYQDAECTQGKEWTFDTAIVTTTTIYAKLTPITPAITWTAPNATDGYTIEVKGTKSGATTESTLTSGDKVAYGSKVTFTITVADGYDATGMKVGVNGILYAPTAQNGNVYTFEFTAKENTTITVVGIERKTITITYSANARDDVSGMPSPQVVKYYLAAAQNDTITTQTPTRTGYTFLGWSTNSEATAAMDGYDAVTVKAGNATTTFTTDTTLYAIWQAEALTAELIITDEFTSAGSTTSVGGKLEYAYEGDSITLVGKLSAGAQGTMTFYKKAKTAKDWTFLGTTSINGGNYGVLGTTVENYTWGNADDANTKSNYRWEYKVEFKPTTDEGYSPCEASDDLRVYSKAISWAVDKKTDTTTYNWINAKNTLTIYTDEARTATTDKMTANNPYWLQIPTVVELDGGRVLNGQSKELSVGTHYEITWEYEDSANHWTTYTTTSDTDWVKVTPEYSGYSFRAKVTPTQSSIYTKATTYDENGSVVKDVYWDYLITKATAKTEKQSTVTALTIDAPEESKDVKINGATPFTADHLAQFEGQTVTLTATVTKENTATAVETGYVKFYRHVDGTNDELLNTTLISVDANGIATLEVKVSAWDTAKNAVQNLDQFYAVYETNETYETSKSDSEAVYIKSTKLQTPVIDSTLAGKLNGTDANSTSYEYDLTGLLAGVQHTFTLRQDAGQTKQDYSVVALDGRSVDSANYTIEWQYKTGDNFATAGNDSTAVKYTTTTTKFGDRYRVKLTGKGVFAGSEATSKDAVIGTKQDVTVTVEAIDAITKTPETDVYQLNEIELTATVAAAKGADATMQPTGTVTFYYKDGDNWVKLDSITLADATDGSGSKIASIKTDKLPVTDTTNTKRDVEITAVYSGDATFNASATVTGAEKYTITAAAGCTTTNDTVTVYSSVVFNCEDENKNQTTDNDKGIHISVSDGAFKANEKATLKLSDIYTLDRGLTGDLLDTIAKLNPNTDYTIQWQKLNGATAIGTAENTDFKDSKNWQDIGATGTTLVLNQVEQNTAYRAVITVNDQPITKGSYKEVEQAIEGRQVYYSNVLMPTDTSMTVSVAINTGTTGSGFEGITKGETVTANVFLSGVVGVVPNANVTVKITNDSTKGNDTAYEKTFTSKNTVNGWNAFDWDTTGVAPGFYTLTVSATTNTGYAAKEITRSLIVRESSYNIEVGNLNPTYNGRTQGLTVKLNGFDFHGTAINEAASKSWTVKYYVQDVEGLETGALVEPTQAGTYKAVVTLPASAYWTEKKIETTFTIKQRSVSIADAIAQAKVYDGTTDVNIVEVMLNDAETDRATTGLPTGADGVINGDSIYAVATEAKLSSANAGDNSFKISNIDLLGDDANNYAWNEAPYTESIYVSRSQVYGNASTDVTLKAGEKLPADAVYMIDQAGNKITAYDVLYYLHTDTEIKKVDNTNEKGLYTVIARPKQDNYKSGVTLKVTVGDATGYTPAVEPQPSTLISISNTSELYGDVKGVNVELSNKDTTYTVKYLNGTTEVTDPTTLNAGRYIVKVTASTGDVAYGVYTITKAHPSIDFETPDGLTYNSMPQNGYTTLTGVEGKDYYITYAGDVAIGYNTPAEGNVDENAPVDAGTYAVTLHVNETANYTAHEISKSFTIAKKALTIKADSWQTTQYDAFPDMTASYTGLAAEDGDTTPDTSLRDVQIAPEFLYNPKDGKSNYSNDSLDQVGGVAIQPIDALSKNYAITYVNGQYTKQRDEASPDLAIHGLPQSSTGKNTVYYGDEIQLYPYGYYTTHANGSGIFNWSVSGAAATIDTDKGILNVTGVGDFTVTLKRGVGEQQISTSVTVTAIQKEAKIALKDVDKVYNGASQTYDYTDNVTVHDELYQEIPHFNASKVKLENTTRTNVGTQITTAKVTGAWAYQSETYGGKFTINDKEATVAPGAQSTVYGTLEGFEAEKYKVDGKAGSVDPVTGVNVASQTDAYNRLDVHDGYEILVAGTENMNYNVKYTTDETAEDSAVKTYGNMKLYSTTTKAKNELNDATVYGEQANTLDWILDAVKSTTRNSATYSDNLADFNLPDTFIQQDKNDCTGNSVTYKAANRTTDVSDSSNIKYNQNALTGPRTSKDTATDENYTLKFSTVENAGAVNYKLTNDTTGNSKTTTDALTSSSKGFISTTEETGVETNENFVEGSANIAQRPIKLEQAVSNAQLYWKLPQSQLYTALVNVLKAEENSTGRGLAKGHTIEDLDLSFSIGGTTVDKSSDQPMSFTDTGKKTVTVTVGDTNYKLEDSNTFEVDFQTMRIRATYYNKTFTGFDVRIEKIDAAGNSAGPLDSTKGLTFKVLKQTNGVLDTETDYATNKSFTFVSKDGTYGYFHGSYSQLPLLGNGELYVFQMYEYGVPLERK